MIFDTNVLIYAERGHESAKEAVLSEREPAISAVTYMEYVSHCRNKEELQVFERMLETLRFAVYEIDSEISIKAREYVRQYALSHSMEMGDALVAATALKYSEMLCTSNAKHFKQISGIDLRVYSPNTA